VLLGWSGVAAAFLGVLIKVLPIPYKQVDN